MSGFITKGSFPGAMWWVTEQEYEMFYKTHSNPNKYWKVIKKGKHRILVRETDRQLEMIYD